MTTATAIFGRRVGPIAPARSTAQSEPASRLSVIYEDLRRHLLDSFVVRGATEAAIEDLIDLMAEVSHEGWDGYGAKAVSLEAYRHARLFLQALPPDTPMPGVSADSDGEVAFDWLVRPGLALTVSIGATGRCSFAWMRGRRSYSGTEWLDDGIPAPIAEALWQLVSEAPIAVA